MAAIAGARSSQISAVYGVARPSWSVQLNAIVLVVAAPQLMVRSIAERSVVELLLSATAAFVGRAGHRGETAMYCKALVSAVVAVGVLTATAIPSGAATFGIGPASPTGRSFTVTGTDVLNGKVTTGCMRFGPSFIDPSTAFPDHSKSTASTPFGDGKAVIWNAYTEKYNQTANWAVYTPAYRINGHSSNGGKNIDFQATSATAIVRGTGTEARC